jgi:MarR family 2-MHQ and catechol resistance regulon transcriptional repressor
MSREAGKIQPVEDTSGTHLWLVLWKSYDAVRSYAFRDIVSLGLGLSDFAILEVLLNKGPCPVNEIGSRVGLTSGSMTSAIDRLEKKALVERRTDTGDRRARVVHLTPEGRKLISCAFGAHARTMDELGDNLSEHERATAIRILKKLGRAAEQR